MMKVMVVVVVVREAEEMAVGEAVAAARVGAVVVVVRVEVALVQVKEVAGKMDVGREVVGKAVTAGVWRGWWVRGRAEVTTEGVMAVAGMELD